MKNRARLRKVGSDTFAATIIDLNIDIVSGPTQRVLSFKRPWRRDIWHDETSGLYFYNLQHDGHEKFTGFHQHVETAEKAILPCFGNEYFPPGTTAEDIECAFVKLFGGLIPRFMERNNRLRPLRSPAEAAARATMQSYMLHHGLIVQASRCCFEDDHLYAWLTIYDEERSWYGNHYSYPIESIKAAGLWQLTDEQEQALRQASPRA